MSIAVRVLRPLLIGGKSHFPGETLSLSATDASAVLTSGRGQLVDPADLATVQAELRRERDKLFATVGRGPVSRPRFG